MPFLSSHKDLFHVSTTMDMLLFFQSLMEARTLNTGEALGLLKTIHNELAHQQGRDHCGYREYALGMNSLRHYMPDVYRSVVDACKTRG